ncbi:MAG: hypothetical protein RID81_06990 [Sandaracinaceae bacterium]
MIRPPRRIRYAPKRGGLVLTLDRHASDVADRLCEAVSRRGGRTVEAVLAEALEEPLRRAYEAGEREGRSAAESGLAESVRRLTVRAVEGIVLEGGRCPHCDGGRTDYGECEECQGTGRARG